MSTWAVATLHRKAAIVALHTKLLCWRHSECYQRAWAARSPEAASASAAGRRATVAEGAASGGPGGGTAAPTGAGGPRAWAAQTMQRNRHCGMPRRARTGTPQAGDMGVPPPGREDNPECAGREDSQKTDQAHTHIERNPSCKPLGPCSLTAREFPTPSGRRLTWKPRAIRTRHPQGPTRMSPTARRPATAATEANERQANTLPSTTDSPTLGSRPAAMLWRARSPDRAPCRSCC